MTDRPQQLQAQVGDAPVDDVAEERARLSRDLIDALHLTAGARVRIAGSTAIVATAHPSGPEDDGLRLVRLDGAQRRRLGVDVGATVTVQRVEPRIAARVALVVLGDLRGAELPLEDVRARLAEQPVIAGDTVVVSPRRKQLDASLSLLGINLAGVVGTISDADGILLRVASTTPTGVVVVDANTSIEVLEPSAAADEAMAEDALDGAPGDPADVTRGGGTQDRDR